MKKSEIESLAKLIEKQTSSTQHKLLKVVERAEEFSGGIKRASERAEELSKGIKRASERSEELSKGIKRVGELSTKLRKYREYTNEQVLKAAAAAANMAGLLKSLDLRIAGGNYATMKRLLQKLEVNCDHWTGQAWNKGEQLKDWSEYTKAASIKPHLIKKRGHKCERCGKTEWQGEAIPLEIDHVNGDRTDNREENLKLYCPNCHALTPTWRGRKNRGRKVKQTRDKTPCKIEPKNTDPHWRKKPRPHKRKVVRPDKEELEIMIQNTTWTAIGVKYGVSDNAIRKWAKSYGIFTKTEDDDEKRTFRR